MKIIARHGTKTLSVLCLSIFCACSDAPPGGNDAAEQPAAQDRTRAQAASDRSSVKAAPVQSNELNGVWMGVKDDTGVLIRFIGSESLQPDRSIRRGNLVVSRPDLRKGSAIEFIDDKNAGVVKLEVALKNKRSSLGLVARESDGGLYLSIYKNEGEPGYPEVSRIPLARISDHQEIKQDDIDALNSALRNKKTEAGQ